MWADGWAGFSRWWCVLLWTSNFAFLVVRCVIGDALWLPWVVRRGFLVWGLRRRLVMMGWSACLAAHLGALLIGGGSQVDRLSDGS